MLSFKQKGPGEKKALLAPRLPNSKDFIQGALPALPRRLPLASYCAAASNARMKGSGSGTAAKQSQVYLDLQKNYAWPACNPWTFPIQLENVKLRVKRKVVLCDSVFLGSTMFYLRTLER